MNNISVMFSLQSLLVVWGLCPLLHHQASILTREPDLRLLCLLHTTLMFALPPMCFMKYLQLAGKTNKPWTTNRGSIRPQWIISGGKNDMLLLWGFVRVCEWKKFSSSNNSLCFLIAFACTPTPTLLLCVCVRACFKLCGASSCAQRGLSAACWRQRAVSATTPPVGGRRRLRLGASLPRPWTHPSVWEGDRREL